MDKNSVFKSQLLIFLAFLPFFGWAHVTLPALVSSDMVLQQNAEVRIWGWGEPLEEVKISTSWNGKVVRTVTDSYANWSVTVQTPASGGPYEIEITGFNKIVLKNILIGEVWICSGQSNMQWPLSGGVLRGEEEIAKADLPNLRLFQVTRKSAGTEQLDLAGQWKVCSPESVRDFSAVGYSFAKRVQAHLGVPVGIINSSWGGTPAEAWIPENHFAASDSLREAAMKLEPQPWGPQKPSMTYNTMIHPLRHLKIAGAIWYQGEANTINASDYEFVLKELIESWRGLWGDELPFYFVQIAPFAYGTPGQGVEVREAQRRVSKLPNMGMVVISDIGDIQDIHPKEKLEVGKRLAGLALKKHYHSLEELVESPEIKSIRMEGRKAHLEFDHAEGLHFQPDAEMLFELAGADGIFFPAKARIRNSEVILVSEQVDQPVFVRFAWGNTSISNLFNAAGLPASSFSTLSP